MRFRTALAAGCLFLIIRWLWTHHLVADRVAMLGDEQAARRGAGVFLREGCYGCHPVPEWPALPAPGPDLTLVRNKLSREWIFPWLTSPERYRPDLRTVSHFLKNDPNLPVETQAMAIASFILSASGSRLQPHPKPQSGGQEVYERIGCAACHGAADAAFANIGVKTSLAWLAQFLRAPERYSGGLPMPNFRLGAKEADALAEFLSQRSDGIFEVRFPHLDESVIAEVDRALRRLSEDYIGGRAADEATAADQEIALGQQLFDRSGCAGCHALRAPRPTAAMHSWPRPALAHSEAKLLRLGQPGEDHPQYALTSSEQEALEAFFSTPLGPPLADAEAGQARIAALACDACHGQRGVASLADEGERRSAEWLLAYLRKPYRLKETMSETMPTYAFSDQALKEVVAALVARP